MKTVIVKNPSRESLPSQALSFLKALQGLDTAEKVTFNLDEVSWCCPMLILPLAAYILETGSDSVVTAKKTTSYLNAIKFPKGVNSVSSLEQQMQKNKSFVPISVLLRNAGADRERLEQMFGDFVLGQLGSIEGTSNVIYYPIGELVGNIFEHSKKEQGYIFGQYYPSKGYFDICIVDRGRGLSGAYKDEKGLSFTDEQAITEVMKGNSTKSDIERGYGVRTSKRVVCEGLKGSFMLISGKSALYCDKDMKDAIVDLGSLGWQGVVIGYRIPIPKNPIDITPYLE
ncbi:MAG TPA: hypothetical protein VFT82_02945 [Candidatus Paceibacterota bacterium]|nr:hypothetical protein [Candidatus Paceibacterota bacterium]